MSDLVLNFEKMLFLQKSSSDFLKYFLTNNPKNGISQNQLSIRAGFSSKSFLSEILSGKKRLNLNSAEKFSKGMRLRKNLAQYFRNLVAIEMANNGLLNKSEINSLTLENEKIVSKATSKIYIDASSQGEIESKKKIMLQENFPIVFAALGSSSEGATVEDVFKRTGIPISRIQKILLEMTEINFIKATDHRYFAPSNLVDFDFLNTDEYFKSNFERSSSRALKKLKSASPVSDRKCLYMTQTFSVDTQNLSALKEKLKNLILEFADSAEYASGDKVSEICISFITAEG